MRFRDCWLLFGGVDDIGYSHSMNLGRLSINRHLQEMYTEHTFESLAYPAVFFMDPDDRELLVNQTIADGCNLLVVSSAGLLNEYKYAEQFPNVSFIGAGGTELSSLYDTIPTNLVEYNLDWFSAAFVSGAVAASVSQTCGGFINAFEDRPSTWSHSMGFALGYHWIKPQQPIHVVTMDSYHNRPAEVLAARQLVEHKGCDVVARHTDPNDVDKYINSLRRTQNRTVFSIARYVDMSTFVGDTVFTSQVWNSFELFYPFVEDAFLGVTKRGSSSFSPNLTDSSATSIGKMELSPFTSVVNRSLAQSVQALALEYLAAQNPLCDRRWRKSGDLLLGSDGSSCLEFAAVEFPESYLLIDTVTYYDAFQDGGVVCNDVGGKYYVYDNLTVSCRLCPTNTFHNPRTRAGESCTPCPVGTLAVEGSTECTKLSTDTTILSLVTSASGILVLVTLAVSIGVARRCRQRDNTNAPKLSHKSPIAIIFTDIQASTTIWAHEPEEMYKAVEAHHELLRKVIRKHKGYEVKTIGDAFMVVHHDMVKALSIALDIQQTLHSYDWGTKKIDTIYEKLTGQSNRKVWNGLRIRVGIAHGTCDGQKDPVTGGWDYYGNTVNCSARVESAAHGGQVLITGQAYRALLMASKDAPSTTAESATGESLSVDEQLPIWVKEEVGIRRVRKHGSFALRGLAESVQLLEITPLGFEERKFPPLRVDDPESESADDQERLGDSIDDFLGSHQQDPEDSLMMLTPEQRMERIMRLCMKAVGVRRYDDVLLQSTWTVFFSMKAMLSLHSAEERSDIVDDMMKRWHLKVPDMGSGVDLDDIGGEDIPKLLMLSIRAATVALADQQPLLRPSNSSSTPTRPTMAFRHDLPLSQHGLVGRTLSPDSNEIDA